MTREQATIQSLMGHIGALEDTITRQSETIKALEQEPILDKIRAEIEEQVLGSLSDGGDDWFASEKVNECLDIIDKYKAESEET